jgi:tRNA A37 threonylcarbamoyladenosine biosynthesis protein TsaE
MGFVGQFVTHSVLGARRAAHAFSPVMFSLQTSVSDGVLRSGITGFPRSGKTRFVTGLTDRMELKKQGIHLFREYAGPNGLLVRHFDSQKISQDIDYTPIPMTEAFEQESVARIDIIEHPQFDMSVDRRLHILWKFRQVAENVRQIECYALPNIAIKPEVQNFFTNVDGIIAFECSPEGL